MNQCLSAPSIPTVSMSTETHWKHVIFCSVCRKPPARLVKELTPTSLPYHENEDPYCRGLSEEHGGRAPQVGYNDFRHDDVFVAVRKCTP